jgi:hypothetical protein
MDLAWGSLAALVILAPGFAFHAGLFSVRGISRETRPRSLPTELCFLLLSALVIHLLLRALYAFLGLFCSFFDVSLRSCVRSALRCICDSTAFGSLADIISQHVGLITIHIGASIALGFAMGVVPGRRILRGPLRALIRHGWVYDVAPPPTGERQYTSAFVMTKIREGDRCLCYQGFVLQIGLTDDGEISYLVLLGPSRFYMILKKEAAESTRSVEIGQSRRTKAATPSEANAGASVRHTLHVSGGSIDNVVFTNVPALRKVDSLAALRRDIEAMKRAMPPSPTADRGGSTSP